MNEIHIKISQNIIKYRLANHLTQKNLAKQLGISPKTLSDIECARKKVSLNILLKLTNVLHVTVDMLLEGTLSFEINEATLANNSKLLKINELLSTATLRKKFLFSKILELYYKI